MSKVETGLHASYPTEMVMPWKDAMSKVRVHDVPYPGKWRGGERSSN